VSYQVLARKYRPQRFADMVGQEPVVRTLTSALGGDRVHHAYVFSGIRGIGKTTSARLLARALNCAKGPTIEPCGTCAACVEIAAGRSLDAIEIDAASNRGIDEVKALIQSAQYQPSRDRHKVFIVDEFHMLTREAFNALLKTLEEPPPHVVFILATTELEKVPATILSRCMLLPFRAVSLPALRQHLLEIAAKEGIELEPAAAELVGRKAGGSVRDAQSTLDRVIALAGDRVTRAAVAEVLGVVDATLLRSLLAATLEGRSADALEMVGGVADSGADLHAFLDDLVEQARALLLAKILRDAGPVLGLADASLGELREVAALGSEEDLRRLLDRLIEAGPRLRAAAEPRFYIEALVVRLCHLVRLEPLADLARKLGGSAAAGGPAATGGGSPRQDAMRRQEASASGGAGAAPTTGLAAPAERAVEPPRGTAPAAGGGSSWRKLLAQQGSGPVEEPEAELTEEPARPARPAPVPVDPLEAFRQGLPARVRGQVDHGLLRRHEDGLAIVLPEDRPQALEHVEQSRFHLMGAAAAAFGRPVPIHLGIEDGLLLRPARAGEIEGVELAARRLLARASSMAHVQALASRFDGRIVDVVPPAAPPS